MMKFQSRALESKTIVLGVIFDRDYTEFPFMYWVDNLKCIGSKVIDQRSSPTLKFIEQMIRQQSGIAKPKRPIVEGYIFDIPTVISFIGVQVNQLVVHIDAIF